MLIQAVGAALVVTAAPAEINRVGIAPHPTEAGMVRIFESSDVQPGLRPAPVDAREPCRLIAVGARARRSRALHAVPTIVDCPVRPAIVAQLGDADDSIVVDERLDTEDRIRGESGADVLVAGRGRDSVDGGSGNDTLAGGLGPDRLIGGAGADTARYDLEQRRVGVVASVGRGADGSREDGGGDLLSGFEHLVGSNRADRLTGNARANTLEGGSGDDVLRGGAGADSLIPGRGADRLFTGRGADVVEARDGRRDRLRCERGGAVVAVDPRDVVRGCATVAVAAAGTLETPVRIGARARRTRGGAVRLVVRCVSGFKCVGDATLAGARARFDIPAQRSRAIVLRPRRRVRRSEHAVIVTDPGEAYQVTTARRVRTT
jgi:preprotein translocase subunit Sec61beta